MSVGGDRKVIKRGLPDVRQGGFIQLTLEHERYSHITINHTFILRIQL